jgi:hypothetical protein
MKRHGDWKALVGVLLGGALLLGCFVPIIYGGYKMYESATTVGITVNIKKPASEVYATTIATIEKNNIWKIVERNDKDMVISVQNVKDEKQTGTVKISVLTPDSSKFIAIAEKVKGVDPAVQKKELVNAVLGTCSALGYQCTEEEEKK